MLTPQRTRAPLRARPVNTPEPKTPHKAMAQGYTPTPGTRSPAPQCPESVQKQMAGRQGYTPTPVSPAPLRPEAVLRHMGARPEAPRLAVASAVLGTPSRGQEREWSIECGHIGNGPPSLLNMGDVCLVDTTPPPPPQAMARLSVSSEGRPVAELDIDESEPDCGMDIE
eukprot:Hpha_TRINITY_DN819_c0_g1::TRINITY_DN819_c0_g1_i1::g.194979::m.194979